MPMATNSSWQATAVALLSGIVWGLLVLVLTLVFLVLGAIVLPAQAYEAPAERSLIQKKRVDAGQCCPRERRRDDHPGREATSRTKFTVTR